MSSPSDLADEALVRRVAEGEHEAFGVLYARHSPGVFRFARLMTGSTAFSEDVVQDVFLDLMRQAAQYDPARGRLTTYLFALARYRVRRQWLRHRRWSPLDVLGDEGPSVTDPMADPHAAAASRQWTAQVRRSVLSLPSRYREVVVLCDLQGLSYAEAASALGVAVGTVRSRLHRGRLLLQDKLAAILRRPAEAGPGAGGIVRTIP
jgi:RNA polymerase sigma-70 factor, ECF subfamily